MRLKRLFMILLLSTSALADFQKTEKLTLDDCISIALQKHQSLKVSDAQVQMAESLYQQAMSAYWPRVSASVHAERADQDRTFSAQGSFALPANVGSAMTAAAALQNPQYAQALNAGLAQPISSIPLDIKMKLYDRDLVTASIDIEYPIFTGLKRPALIGQAKKGIKIAEQGRRKSSLEIVRDVKKYFYAAQFARQMEQLADATLERFKVLEELTERLYQNGSLKVKKTDYLRTKVTTAITRSMLHEAQYAKDLAHEALGNAMGQSWNAQYRLVETKMPKKLTAELAELVEAAQKFNPDIQQLSLAVQLTGDRITAAQSGYYPMVGVHASAYKLWNDYDAGLINDDNRNGWSIGIGMQWNLFNGFETTGKVNHAKAEQKKVQSQSVLLDQGMALQIKQQFLRIRSSGLQIQDNETAFSYARQNRKLHTRAYQQEMVETKDVIEAQLVESFAQSAYYRSRYALETGLSSLEFLIGHNLEELNMYGMPVIGTDKAFR